MDERLTSTNLAEPPEVCSREGINGVTQTSDDARIARVEGWLQGVLGNQERILSMERLAGGQSNPTYALITTGSELVLRAKPSGDLVPSAHAVEREYRVQSSLRAVGFPVPRVFALCFDKDVFGSVFYVMERVAGRQFFDATLPKLQHASRADYFSSMIRTLAALHRINPADVGLSDYGRPGNYFRRQLRRLSRQYLEVSLDPLGDMRYLIQWLDERAPTHGQSRVVHGDYRMDNILFSPNKSEIVAVLDWELSTLADPIADLSYLLMHWDLPQDGRSGLAGLDLPALGLPSERECAELYCELSGRSALPDLTWYKVFQMFRLAVLYEGISARVRGGNAAGADALRLIQAIPTIAVQAVRIAKLSPSGNS
jgi:aminoglycoside phosphotransferase (APT) family kinase protein